MKRARELVRSEPVRVYVYGLVSALVAVAVLYDRVTGAQGAGWLALLGAVLAGPVVEGARSRVSPTTPTGPHDVTDHDVT